MRTSPAQTPSHDYALAVGNQLDSWAQQRPAERSDYKETLGLLGRALVLEESE